MIRKIRSLFIKISIRLKQKKHKKLTYLFKRGKSDTLIVSFSGFAGNNGPARYNYIDTLRNFDTHKLFLLDNFGYKKQGSYYLGENGNWFVPEMVIELINKIRKEYDIKHLVMVGSSKGGTAALYYAVKTFADFCVIGAPQYYIGDYLGSDNHLPILEGITGDITPESVKKLNDVVKCCVCSAKQPKPRIYIHYSPLEHTYNEHIVYMLNDLKEQNYVVLEDSNYNYSNHSEVAKYFPEYLKKILNENLYNH